MLDTLCMGCMKEIGDARQCPHCGFSVDTPQIAPYLPLRTQIGGRDVAGKMLSAAGDGAAYIGWERERKTAGALGESFAEQE